MQIDWVLLGKLDVICGIFGGLILVFSIIRGVGRRMKSSRVTNILAWAITGQNDEQALISSLKLIARLAFAAIVWAIIGAIIGMIVVIILTLMALGTDGRIISGTKTAIAQYATIGAFIGAVFRAIILPMLSWIQRIWQKYRKECKAKYDDFVTQKTRVESKINRGKNHD